MGTPCWDELWDIASILEVVYIYICLPFPVYRVVWKPHDTRYNIFVNWEHVPFWGDLELHITWKSICWRWYQEFGDVQVGHLPTRVTAKDVGKTAETFAETSGVVLPVVVKMGKFGIRHPPTWGSQWFGNIEWRVNYEKHGDMLDSLDISKKVGEMVKETI